MGASQINDHIDSLHELNVLDTEHEERFDRLTRLVKRMFDAPMSMVSLVDTDRVWFKSCPGLGVSEVPREKSFCSEALLSDEIFIIPDTTKDARFADSPIVIDDPKIRFYVGYPLKTSDSVAVGTLCMMDQKPRTFSDEDINTFKDLAMMAENELTAIQMATTDELTKISNRRGFMELAQNSLNFSNRHGYKISLVYFDLDGFKSINDKFGHTEGDKVLIKFADELKNAFRDSDIFARLGGDEFIAMMSGADEKAVDKALDRLQKNINLHNKTIQSGYNINYSTGKMTYVESEHSIIENMLIHADKAMYEQKNLKKETK